MTALPDHDGAPAPVAIGGVGGSGTRLVAQLLQAAGIHMGSDRNEASDTLWFTLLFKRIEILHCGADQFRSLLGALVAALRQGTRIDATTEAMVRSLAETDRPQHPAGWLEERAESLLLASRQAAHGGRWGWKEPNTHILIDRIWQQLPSLRYIHVVRNGVDMARSRNQAQLKLWGAHVLGCDGPVTPSRSLAYWCKVHRRMQELLGQNPGRMYWLDYDALCRDPRPEAGKLCRFLDCDPASMTSALDAVRAPRSRGSVDMCQFDEGDLAYARSLSAVAS